MAVTEGELKAIADDDAWLVASESVSYPPAPRAVSDAGGELPATPPLADLGAECVPSALAPIPLSSYDSDYKIAFTAYSFPGLEPRKLFLVELEKSGAARTLKHGVCCETPAVFLDLLAAFGAAKRDDVVAVFQRLCSLA
jgi:hypothetical protein